MRKKWCRLRVEFREDDLADSVQHLARYGPWMTHREREKLARKIGKKRARLNEARRRLADS